MIGACDTAETTTSTLPSITAATATTEASPPSTTSTAEPTRTLAVPAHQPPVIDGVLDTDEWHGSTTVTMSDLSSLHWMHTEDVLYVALEGSAVGAVNPVISTVDETWTDSTGGRNTSTERNFNLDEWHTLVLVGDSAADNSIDKGRMILTEVGQRRIMDG
jgi:hypothetical protein